MQTRDAWHPDSTRTATGPVAAASHTYALPTPGEPWRAISERRESSARTRTRPNCSRSSSTMRRPSGPNSSQESRFRQRRGIGLRPGNRVPMGNGTVLADASRYQNTGRRMKGATIYRGSDGRYCHRDALHKGKGAAPGHHRAPAHSRSSGSSSGRSSENQRRSRYRSAPRCRACMISSCRSPSGPAMSGNRSRTTSAMKSRPRW